VDSARFPSLSDELFAILSERSREDPRIAEHLVHVCAIGLAIQEQVNVLSSLGTWEKDLLKHVLLFHDFGGCLNAEKESEELKTWTDLGKVTKLRRRYLDTDVMECLVDTGKPSSKGLFDRIRIFNDDVNSAASFIRDLPLYSKNRNMALRDVGVMVIQCHDSPFRFRIFLEDYENFRSAWETADVASEEESSVFVPSVGSAAKIYAITRIADALSFANWRWKRRQVARTREGSARRGCSETGEPENWERTRHHLTGGLRSAGFPDGNQGDSRNGIPDVTTILIQVKKAKDEGTLQKLLADLQNDPLPPH
jgi:hypothetical protein